MSDPQRTATRPGARRRDHGPWVLVAAVLVAVALAAATVSGCALAPPMSDPGPAPDPAPFTTAQRATAGTLGFGRLSTTTDSAVPPMPDTALASAGRAILGDTLGVPLAQPGAVPDLRLSAHLEALRRVPDGGALVGRVHLRLERPAASAPLWAETITARADASSMLLQDALRRAAARAPFRRALLASASPPAQGTQPRVPSETVPAGTLTLRGAPLFLAPLAVHAADLAPSVATVLRDGAATGAAVILSPDGWAITGASTVGAAEVVRVRLSDGREPWARVLRRGPHGAVVLLGITAERLSALPLRPTPPEAGEALFALAPVGSKGGGGATIAPWVGLGASAGATDGSVFTAGALVDAWANGVALLGAGPPGAPVGPMPLAEALARLGVDLVTPPPQ